jgi:hypothetical protein
MPAAIRSNVNTSPFDMRLSLPPRRAEARDADGGADSRGAGPADSCTDQIDGVAAIAVSSSGIDAAGRRHWNLRLSCTTTR